VSRLLDRRFVAVGAPIVYSVALAVTVATWGLPVARDQLFFWIGLGLLAFSVSAWRSWGQLVIEWLPFFALLAAYDWLRGAVAVAPAQAHLMPQLDFDKFLFFGTVPTVWLQQHLWHPTHFHWYDYGIWGVYMTHFFAVWVVAAVIWHTRRPLFRRYAVMVIGVTVGAFLTYWLYPAQPPWLPSGGPLLPPIDRIVPQVWDQLGVHTLASVYENHDFVNPVAAMPSLHAAYPFMLMLFFWSAGRWVRIALGAYTLAMAFTLVYGGEHFVTDILAGWALALAVHGILRAWQARKHSSTRGDAKSASPAPTV
jgi:membrane-associated phospholipid phosphatase